LLICLPPDHETGVLIRTLVPDAVEPSSRAFRRNTDIRLHHSRPILKPSQAPFRERHTEQAGQHVSELSTGAFTLCCRENERAYPGQKVW